MPELPEVETIKNELLPWVVGQRVTQVTILDGRLVSGISVEEFRRRLIGQMIDDIGRRGKYIIFHLASGQSLIIHLRMTGALLLNPNKADRYARAVLQLSNGVQLVFSDRRRLGVMWLVKDASDIVCKLGPEPLSGDFTTHVLAQTLSKHRIPIKAALIDQSLVAGIGNMYADEALFAAKIHPLERADNLSSGQIKTLYRSIREVLRSAISSKGASVDTYVRPEGELGTAQFSFKVAHRGSKPCLVCGTPIQRILVRNRGSYFCPSCQPS
ncbi:MAG: bifunctional DNA-formamidopyrimidine glycosylase/DNA-(apurinic or apyrimidinic site) lyase [Chloroflexota bacterium]|nr:bifunctional DNA-formamidopyrimidine glycosylase/DNA-(apurinic or apyrimidinic site) lyase [Chloroflexota bacterium]